MSSAATSTDLPTITSVCFEGGPLSFERKQMGGVQDYLVAWSHKQARGIVQVAWVDETDRQESLWEPTLYQLDRERSALPDYALYVALAG